MFNPYDPNDASFAQDGYSSQEYDSDYDLNRELNEALGNESSDSAGVDEETVSYGSHYNLTDKFEYEQVYSSNLELQRGNNYQHNYEQQQEQDLIDLTSVRKDNSKIPDVFDSLDQNEARKKLLSSFEDIVKIEHKNFATNNGNNPSHDSNLLDKNISKLNENIVSKKVSMRPKSVRFSEAPKRSHYREHQGPIDSSSEQTSMHSVQEKKQPVNIQRDLLSEQPNSDFHDNVYSNQDINTSKSNFSHNAHESGFGDITQINNLKSKSLYDLYKGNGIFAQPNNIFSEPLKPAHSSGWVFKWGSLPRKQIDSSVDSKIDSKFQLRRSVVSQPKTRMWGFDNNKANADDKDNANYANTAASAGSGSIVGSKQNVYLKDPPLPVEVFLLPSSQSAEFMKNTRHSIGVNVLRPTLTSGGKSLQMSTQVPLSRFDQRIKL